MIDRLSAVNHMLQAARIRPVSTLSGRTTVALTAGSWNNTTKVLTQSSVFTSYTWQSGDMLYLLTGTGINAQWYEISAATANTATIPSLNVPNATDWTATLIRGYRQDTSSEAERILDLASLRVQTRGLEANVDKCRPITVANTAIDSRIAAFGTNVVKVQGAGPQAYRNFTLRNGAVWDKNLHTSAFTNSDIIYLDIWRHLPFEQCPEDLALAILDEAKTMFQQRHGGDPVLASTLEGERAMSEFTVSRAQPRTEGQPINVNPLIRQNPPAQ